MAGVVHLKRICKDAFSVAGAALRMTWHQFFVVGAILYLDRWSGKIVKRIGMRLSALHLTFYF